MKTPRAVPCCGRRVWVGVLSWLFLTGTIALAESSASIKAQFPNPPREYATAPLWVWNDDLSEAQVRGTLRDLAGQHVRQVFVHPRPGLMTPYLSEDWFRLWKVALEEAARLDMNVWIYDENSYPSGFGGGWVPELMPESRGRGLHWEETGQPPAWDDAMIGVYRLGGDQIHNVTAAIRQGQPAGPGPFLVAKVRRSGNSGWYGGRCYVDLLYPGVTEKFIEVTHAAYLREVGQEFGRRLPGIFTDEPQLRPAGGLPWTDDVPQQVAGRADFTGFLDQLPGLVREVGDWRRVRHHYYYTLNELFLERWCRPNSEFCETNQLEWTGHYWDHEWPNCVGVPDNMAAYAWHQRPAIDCLMNQYAEHTHAQFGNIRMCRELSSVANQLGRQRTLCEIYGAGGWDLRFEDMKRIADWLGVLGVNTFDEHLSYVTLRGARKRDHPQSFSYHEPWWEDYHVMADYLTRLSLALSHGRPVNRVLVLQPTTTAWMYQGQGAKLKAIGDSFFALLRQLESAQVEYDLGSEWILEKHAWVEGPRLRVGKQTYDVVVLPPHTENINQATFVLGEELLQKGGQVVCLGEPPVRIQGVAAEALAGLESEPGWTRSGSEQVVEVLQRLAPSRDFSITRQEGDQGILFHQRRVLDDGELLFLVNTSMEHASRGVVRSTLWGVEEWDLRTGVTRPCAYQGRDDGVRVDYELPPCGSRLLFLSRVAGRPKKVEPEAEGRIVPPKETVAPRRLGPNVLTLDFVDVEVGDEKREDVYFYAANRWIWQKHGMPGNPWDSAVQFKDELIRRTFPAGSGFTASYTFTIDGAVPEGMGIVIERPDLYEVTCNGQVVKGEEGRWWLDRSFGRLDLGGLARTGKNTVTVQASPFTVWHELEPAYLVGDFTLRASEQGFVVVPDQTLSVPAQAATEGSAGRGWNEQGFPFYAEGFAYGERFEVADPQGRYEVRVPDWHGSVARVKVNGRLAGHLVSRPWVCDVTDGIKAGDNLIEVEVVGTLKNTLGPHHGNPPLGSAWPGMFQQGPEHGPPPGKSYQTVAYGLFAPFELRWVGK